MGFHQNCYHILLIWIVLCGIVNSQRIINKPADDEFQCPGGMMVFTCETRGSFLITWRSNQYIGLNRIEFSTNSNEGDVNPFSNITTARLTRNVVENGEQILESQLTIMVGSNVPTASITCARDNGMTDVVTLRILVDPPIMLDIIIMSNQGRLNSTGGCVVYYAWALPKNVTIDFNTLSHFMISFNGTQLHNESVNPSLNMYMYAHYVCTCNTHSISIAAIDRCGREGNSMVDFVENPEPLNDSVCRADLSFNGSRIMGCPDEGLNVVAIIVGVFHVLPWSISVILLIMLIWMCCKYPPFGKSRKIDKHPMEEIDNKNEANTNK